MQLLCLGDVALADARLLEKKWSPPAGFKPGEDAKIVFNWELPIGNQYNPQPRSSGMRLLAHPQAAQIISNWSPGIAALATNHILDAEVRGLMDTMDALEGGGFEFVGAGTTQQAISDPLILDTCQGKIAIINWVFPETHPDWMAVPGPNCWPGTMSAREIIQKLKRSVDWIIAVVHWSDEFFPYPRPQDRQIARELAGLGVDLIIGHHPHVVRGMEIIGSCPVFYSIGNFFFSNIPDGQGGWVARQAPRNREVLGVLLEFQAGEKVKVQVHPFWQTKDKTGDDRLHRATRRLRSVSVPLHDLDNVQYSEWYRTKRAHFDRWSYRLNFGLWYLGKRGFVRYARKLLPPQLLRTISGSE